jgi:hypothetical protein
MDYSSVGVFSFKNFGKGTSLGFGDLTNKGNLGSGTSLGSGDLRNAGPA